MTCPTTQKQASCSQSSRSSVVTPSVFNQVVSFVSHFDYKLQDLMRHAWEMFLLLANTS